MLRFFQSVGVKLGGRPLWPAYQVFLVASVVLALLSVVMAYFPMVWPAVLALAVPAWALIGAGLVLGWRQSLVWKIVAASALGLSLAAVIVNLVMYNLHVAHLKAEIQKAGSVEKYAAKVRLENKWSNGGRECTVDNITLQVLSAEIKPYIYRSTGHSAELSKIRILIQLVNNTGKTRSFFGIDGSHYNAKLEACESAERIFASLDIALPEKYKTRAEKAKAVGDIPSGGSVTFTLTAKMKKVENEHDYVVSFPGHLMDLGTVEFNLKVPKEMIKMEK